MFYCVLSYMVFPEMSTLSVCFWYTIFAVSHRFSVSHLRDTEFSGQTVSQKTDRRRYTVQLLRTASGRHSGYFSPFLYQDSPSFSISLNLFASSFFFNFLPFFTIRITAAATAARRIRTGSAPRKPTAKSVKPEPIR